MAATRKIGAEAVARAAMAAIRAHDKGAIPTANPNAHEPRRVTAHLGDFRVEAEFPLASTETTLMIDRNGAPMLKAQVQAVWKGENRTDKIDLVDVRGQEWFAAFLEQTPRPPDAKPRRQRMARRGKARTKAARKPRRTAAVKALKPRRAKPAGRRTKKAGAKAGRRRRG